MGFEVSGERQWNLPVSDVQAYRQMGNAVVPQVVEAIARHMEPYIEASLEPDAEPHVPLTPPIQLRIEDGDELRPAA